MKKCILINLFHYILLADIMTRELRTAKQIEPIIMMCHDNLCT